MSSLQHHNQHSAAHNKQEKPGQNQQERKCVRGGEHNVILNDCSFDGLSFRHQIENDSFPNGHEIWNGNITFTESVKIFPPNYTKENITSLTNLFNTDNIGFYRGFVPLSSDTEPSFLLGFCNIQTSWCTVYDWNEWSLRRYISLFFSLTGHCHCTVATTASHYQQTIQGGSVLEVRQLCFRRKVIASSQLISLIFSGIWSGTASCWWWSRSQHLWST